MRKYVFLSIFVISVILIFNITNAMLPKGFSETIGLMESYDKRFAISLIALFGLVGYFLEEALQRLKK